MSRRTFSSGLSSTYKAYKPKTHSLTDQCGTLKSLTKSLVLYIDIKIFTKIIHLLSHQFSNLGSTVHHISIYQSNSVEKMVGKFMSMIFVQSEFCLMMKAMTFFFFFWMKTKAMTLSTCRGLSIILF